MFDWFRRLWPRNYDVNDLLPFVEVPKGEKPIALERLDVAVVISGMFAETTQTMVFRNPNGRVLEGQLTFPLPGNGVVCGYAIDVDGELVEGVIVPKQEARRILEAEIRKGVDPGLVEQVQGNLYRTRIYPLPPGMTRTVRLTYVSDLIVDGNSAGYHLPLGHAKGIEQVTLRVEIAKGEVTPEVSGGVGNLSLAKLRDSFVAEATLPRGAAADDLIVRLPDLPRHLRTVERRGDETFFAISSAVPAAEGSWRPERVALAWDASGSRTDIEKELELLAALVDAWPSLVVDVRVVRDTSGGLARTFRGRGERDALIGFLRAEPRDGATNLAALDLGLLPDDGDQAWLLCSDGLDTVGRRTPIPGAVPVIAISSSPRGDAAYLRHVAEQSGGLYVDLASTTVAAAVELIGRAREPLRLAGTEGAADVHVQRSAGRLSIIGRLVAEIGQVRLAGDGAPDDHLSITRAMATDGHLVARAWAGQETRALAVTQPDAPAILELARRHGVVTASASILVLDTLAQHLEYGIEPAASRKELRAQYLAAKDKTKRDERDTKDRHLDQVVTMWQARVRWWETDWRPRPVAKKKAGAPREERPRGPVVDAMMADRFDAESDASVMAEMAPPAQAMAPMPPPSPAPMRSAGAPMMARMAAPAGAMAGGPLGGAPAAEPADAAPRASIAIKPWSADTPYLTRLRAAGDAYAAYLRERGEYGGSPAFFLDCGDFFLGKGERATGLRVLSNLLELGLDDPPLLRMYGWRLQAAGELDGAIKVFERVRRMREDEPQSHRDLALALGERWERSGDAEDATRALNLLYDVIDKEWDRFPEIELIALMELNRLIARTAARGIETPKRIDRRLVRLLDLDLRISMSWDLDLTDVDLHVYEPNGEHAYYGQNQTGGGGLVSRDFRQGYGPEEYVRRRAEPGGYQVKAHYYGSQQQDIAGACTVIVQVTTNFARANEERQTLTLRLDRPSDQVMVGEVTFAGAAAAEDWRPTFKQLRRGMAIDEITAVVGQPVRLEGAGEMVMVYEPGGDVVHVVVAPRLTAVRQVMDGAVLDLL